MCFYTLQISRSWSLFFEAEHDCRVTKSCWKLTDSYKTTSLVVQFSVSSGLIQGWLKTGPFLKLCNCCMRRLRKALCISNVLQIVRSKADILNVVIFKFSLCITSEKPYCILGAVKRDRWSLTTVFTSRLTAVSLWAVITLQTLVKHRRRK